MNTLIKSLICILEVITEDTQAWGVNVDPDLLELCNEFLNKLYDYE